MKKLYCSLFLKCGLFVWDFAYSGFPRYSLEIRYWAFLDSDY